jgi:hypothetical protein
MRTSTLFRNSLCAAGLALLGLSGCGPDYAIFKVHVKSANPRNDIEACYMSIQDVGTGKMILDTAPLSKETGVDPSGAFTLKQGCQGGVTPSDVGYFSYSTSRSSGTLRFTVIGTGNEVSKILQIRSAEAEVKAYPPEISVDLFMGRCDDKASPPAECPK